MNLYDLTLGLGRMLITN